MKHKNSKQHIEKFLAKRKKRRAEGCCLECEKKPKKGSRCFKHAVAHAARQQRYFDKKKEERKCELMCTQKR